MRRARWTPLGLALLCSHCALTGLLAILGLTGAGAAVSAFLGVDVNYVWPPLVLLGLFGFLVWSGRRRASDEGEACALPERGAGRP